MKFEELEEFRKDLKRLLKKYRSLKSDLSTIKQVLEVLPDERPPFSYRISNLGIETCVIKVKKIACQSLKGKGVNSGLRLIYAYFEGELEEEGESTETLEADKNEVEEEINELEVDSGERIVFIELYHKNEKSLEDKERILRNFA